MRNSTIEMILKNPMSRAEQEREDCGHAVYRNWCAACVEARGVGGQLQEEEERERTTPRVAFDNVLLTLENADIFPILICREHVFGRAGATCCERKDSIAYSISFLVNLRILLEDETEPSTKVFQDAMIQSCVEVAVRETKRQCIILRISVQSLNKNENC